MDDKDLDEFFNLVSGGTGTTSGHSERLRICGRNLGGKLTCGYVVTNKDTGLVCPPQGGRCGKSLAICDCDSNDFIICLHDEKLSPCPRLQRQSENK
jgi:hypothetical protein